MDKSNIPDRYRYLASKWKDGSITPEEAKAFADWYNTDQDKEVLIPKQFAKDLNNLEKSMFQAILRKTGTTKRVSLWPRIAVAAAVATIIFGTGLFYFSKEKVKPEQVAVSADDVAPGKVGATLTLANGKKIRLADAVNGELAKEAGVVISKTADGQLVYEVTQTNAGANKINTLSTEKGETYIVILPDKSKVWLNAFSVLKYPANFVKNGKRTVELSGEGYFEIAKDRAHPFVVKTAQQQVEVLGTHFNINAYSEDASTKTTLLEGSVKVISINSSLQGMKQTQILKPNQQAEINGTDFTVKDIEGEYSIAWKNGFFMFDDERLEMAMTRIARWYNVRVVYEDEEARGGNYFGRISKYENISKVLHMLSKTDLVTFKIEGNTVRISKRK